VQVVSSTTHGVTQRLASPEALADLLLTYYGRTHTAAQKLDDDGRAAPRDDMVALAHAVNVATDGTFAVDWEYRVLTAVKNT
jgi:hypothetical protein